MLFQRLRLAPAFVLFVLISPILVIATPVLAQDFVLEMPDTTASAGGPIDIPVLVSSPVDLSGAGLGTCHDETQLAVNNVVLSQAMQALNGDSGPVFFAVEYFPSGIACGTIFSFAPDEVLPAGEGLHFVTMEHQSLMPIVVKTTLSIDFCETQGDPAIENVLSDAFAQNFSPIELGCTLTLLPAPNFIRGDSNNSGNLNIADVVGVLGYLFTGLQLPCVEALDIDADGSIGLPDALRLLLYLNGLESPPAAPFPSCGMASEPAHTCASFSACP